MFHRVPIIRIQTPKLGTNFEQDPGRVVEIITNGIALGRGCLAAEDLILENVNYTDRNAPLRLVDDRVKHDILCEHIIVNRMLLQQELISYVRPVEKVDKPRMKKVI